MTEEVMVHKATLSSGKVVLLREIKIKDQENAAKIAGSTIGSDNQVALAMGVQKELIKLLVVQVNNKKIKPSELEDLDSVFTYREYQELSRVLQNLMGEDGGNVQTELVAFGGQ